MIVAFTWAWDGAELYYRSSGFRDTSINGGLLVAATFLFLFNALVEIPHFFAFQRDTTDAAGTPVAGDSASCIEVFVF